MNLIWNVFGDCERNLVNNYGNKLMTSKGTFGRSIINLGVYLCEKLPQLWDHFGYSFWGFTKIEVKHTMRHDYWDLMTWILWYDIYVNHTLNHMPNWFVKHSNFLTFKFGNVIDDYQYVKPSFFENKPKKKKFFRPFSTYCNITTIEQHPWT